ARGTGDEFGQEHPTAHREDRASPLAISRVAGHAGRALAGALAASALGGGELTLLLLAGALARIEHAAFLAARDVEHPQAADRVVARLRPQEHDPLAVRRDREGPRRPEAEPTGPSNLPRELVERVGCRGHGGGEPTNGRVTPGPRTGIGRWKPSVRGPCRRNSTMPS